MAARSATLMVQIQLALGVTQAGLGAMLGRDKRTIQRWQRGGTSLMPAQAVTLANALRPVRQDLADELLALAAKTEGELRRGRAASPETIDAILEAAAKAGRISLKAARPIVTAAFRAASELGAGTDAALLGLAARKGAG